MGAASGGGHVEVNAVIGLRLSKNKFKLPPERLFSDRRLSALISGNVSLSDHQIVPTPSLGIPPHPMSSALTYLTQERESSDDGRAGMQKRRIWSLLQIMKDFEVWALTRLLDFIDRSRQHIHLLMIDDGKKRDEYVSGEYLKTFDIEAIIFMAHSIAMEIKLQSTFDRVWSNGPFAMAVKVGITYSDLHNQLTTLRECIEFDLEKRHFVFVEPDKDKLYRSTKDDWEPIWKNFPSVFYDSQQAVNSYALELNTACVFHSMRVTEIGLRALARRMKIKFPKRKQLEWQEWQHIITEMTKHADSIAASWKAGRKKDEILEFYRGAIGEFSGFKDAYRNAVMHMREKSIYNEYEARGVLTRVHDFMNRLTKRIDEKGKAIAKEKHP